MLETKEYASELWDNLSKGLDALYEKYQTLLTQTDADYRGQIDALAPAYQTLKNRASVQNQIARANLDRRLAERGLASSGESTQRQLLQSAALQNDLTLLDLDRRQKETELESARLNSRAKLSAEQSGSAADYIADMTKIYQDQVNKDQQYALEREKLRIQEEHNKAQEELALKQYELKKEQLAFEQSVKRAYSASSASSSQNSSSASSAGAAAASAQTSILGIGGTKLSSYGTSTYAPKNLSAKALVDSLADNKTGSARLRTAIQEILADSRYDKNYRYEVLLYSRLKGYL